MSTSDKNSIFDLPPSAKLVYKVLEYNDRLTQQEIVTESRLPPRTVRFALSELDSVGLVEDDISFSDARQRIYRLDNKDSNKVK